MPVIPRDNLDEAFAAYAAGDPAAADAICMARLRDGRGCAGTLQLLGLLRSQAGRHAQAVALLDTAVQCAPALPGARLALGGALAASGAHEAALVIYQGLLDPGEGDPEAALLGAAAALGALQRWPEAEAHYARALALRPASVPALHGRGVALTRLHRHPDALACLNVAAAEAPHEASTHLALGRALTEVGRPAAALGSLRRAIELDPDDPEATCALGAALARLGRHAEALPWLERALRGAPRMADAYRHLGNALSMLRQDEAGLACLREARRLAPDNADYASDEAGMLLRAGRLIAGFALYERRDFALTLSRLAPPVWDGAERIAGEAILLIAEQGLGDTLQFIRYAPRVAALGAAVTVEVQPPLAALLATVAAQWGVRIVPRGAPRAPAAWQCALLSLPHALRTRLDTIPAACPYLQAPPEARARWHARLANWPCPPRARVGLCASGNPRHRHDAQRSAGLAALAPLFDVPGIDWVLLQPDPNPADAAALAARPDVRHPGAALADFVDTAALIERLDLVITVDTAVAHLAGALHVPVWILLPYVADWRWLQDRDDSPWYPSARLFRQDATRDWAVPVADAAAALARWPRSA